MPNTCCLEFCMYCCADGFPLFATKFLLLLLTANATKQDELECLEAGFDLFLTKPIDREKLLEALACYLSISDKSQNSLVISEETQTKIEGNLKVQVGFMGILSCIWLLKKSNMRLNFLPMKKKLKIWLKFFPWKSTKLFLNQFLFYFVTCCFLKVESILFA